MRVGYKRAARLCCLFALACFSLAAGCGRAVERKAEQAVKEILPEYLGPADKYDTRVRGSVGGIVKGRLSSVHVEGKNVRLMPDFNADLLTLDLRDVEVDTKRRVLTEVGSCDFAVALSEASLNRYIRSKRSDIRDLSISLRDRQGRITVTARPEVLGIASVPVSVTGRVQANPPHGISMDFNPERARVSIVPVPGVVLDYFSRRLNPLLDLSNLRVPVQVRRTEVREGRLVVQGIVRPEDLIRAAVSASAAP